MPPRNPPIDNIEAAFDLIGKRIRSIQDTQRERALPPGYSFNIVDGDLVIIRSADGATSTLAFT